MAEKDTIAKLHEEDQLEAIRALYKKGHYKDDAALAIGVLLRKIDSMAAPVFDMTPRIIEKTTKPAAKSVRSRGNLTATQ